MTEEFGRAPIPPYQRLHGSLNRAKLLITHLPEVTSFDGRKSAPDGVCLRFETRTRDDHVQIGVSCRSLHTFCQGTRLGQGVSGAEKLSKAVINIEWHSKERRSHRGAQVK